MSACGSDTPQTRYTHVTGALHTLNARLTPAWDMLQNPANVQPMALGEAERACSVHDVPYTCTESVRNVFNVLVTQMKHALSMGRTPKLQIKNNMHA